MFTIKHEIQQRQLVKAIKRQLTFKTNEIIFFLIIDLTTLEEENGLELWIVLLISLFLIIMPSILYFIVLSIKKKKIRKSDEADSKN